MRKMGNWIYRGEGDATAPPEKTVKWSPQWLKYPWMILVMAPIFILPQCEFLPPQYWQPLTALLWVPLVSYTIVRPMRGGPAPSRLMLLWPGLYGLHAVLIMAGIPIYVTSEHAMLVICGLFIGYAVLAGLLSHIYSRIALRRLRALATSPEMVDEAGRQEQ